MEGERVQRKAQGQGDSRSTTTERLGSSVFYLKRNNSVFYCSYVCSQQNINYEKRSFFIR